MKKNTLNKSLCNIYLNLVEKMVPILDLVEKKIPIFDLVEK